MSTEWTFVVFVLLWHLPSEVFMEWRLRLDIDWDRTRMVGWCLGDCLTGGLCCFRLLVWSVALHMVDYRCILLDG